MSDAQPEGSRDLRKLSTAELVQLGEQSLRQRLVEQARYAYLKYSPFGSEKLPALLNDPECARYPTRLVFEFGEMAMHQFAQPDVDHRNPEQEGRVLYLRPLLRDRPDLVLVAVAYMLPVLNYGEKVITDAHCVLYGATLLGMTEDEFYKAVCDLADFAGCEMRTGNTEP
jgi:hypothetical protein